MVIQKTDFIEIFARKRVETQIYTHMYLANQQLQTRCRTSIFFLFYKVNNFF